MWVLLELPRFGGANHASGYHHRSRHCVTQSYGLALGPTIASKRFGLPLLLLRESKGAPEGCAIDCTLVAAIGVHEARPLRSIKFQIMGVKISCIARGILPPGQTIVFARDMKEFGIIDMR